MTRSAILKISYRLYISVLIFLTHTTAYADVLTYEVTARVNSILDLSGGAGVNGFFNPGDTVMLRFTYDTATPGSGSTSSAQYPGAIKHFTFSYSNGYAGAATSGTIYEQNDVPVGPNNQPTDNFIAESTENDGWQAPPIGNAHLVDASVLLVDSSATAFTSTSLVPLPPLSAFTGSQVETIYQNATGGTSYVKATALSISRAATITWGPVMDETGSPSDVVTTGLFFDSAAAYPTTDVVLNGVVFNPQVSVTGGVISFANGSRITVSSSNWFSTRTAFGFPPGGWDSSYRTLVGGGASSLYTGGSITINGLTIGESYLIQIWEPWWNWDWATSYSDGINSSGPLNLGTYGSPCPWPLACGPSPAQYITGTFTADATTQTISFIGADGYSPNREGIFTAIQVRRLVPDETPPTSRISTGPASPTTDTTATFFFSGTDDVTSAADLIFECRLDGSTFSTCSSPASYIGLTEGPHTFYVRATDGAGNLEPTPASFNWTIDLTAPGTIIDSMPLDVTNSTTATFTFHATITNDSTTTESGDSFECSLNSIDGGAFASCASPRTYNGLTDGDYTFMVRAKDAADNTALSSASFSWTVDRQAPDTVIDSAPLSITNSNTATFTFHGSDMTGDSFVCSLTSLNNGAFASCTSPQTYSGLADGSYRFIVGAQDPAGNMDLSPVAFDWLIDSLPPAISVTSPTANATYQLNASIAASYACADSASGVATCQGTVANGSPIDTSSTGTKTFTVTSRDNVGNATSATVTYTVATGGGSGSTSADLGITLSAPSKVSPNGTITYSISVSNAGKATATGVRVFNGVPNGVLLTSVSASQGTILIDSFNGVQVQLGSMADGGSATIRIVGTVGLLPAGTVLSDTATVTAITQDLNRTNNSATQNTTVSKK